MSGSSSLQERLREVYPGVLVNKSYTLRQELRRLPRLVAEWVVDRFCKDGVTPERIEQMDEFVRDHYPEPRERQSVLSKIMEQGSFALIDCFRVETDLANRRYKLQVPSLDIRNGRVIDTIVFENERLLVDGVWAVGVLQYLADEEAGTVMLTKLAPLGVSSLDLEAYREGRSKFSASEWMDLIINTFGLNPDSYANGPDPEWTKLVLLSRAIPLVEPNVNLVELGPKGTGKTTFHREISYHSRIISGGSVTPATLFYNLSTRRDGLLVIYDSVVFDELPTLDLSGGGEILGKLKDYMESGRFDRGPKQARSECSLVFTGNVEVLGDKPADRFFFEAFSEQFRDSAFFDRLHGCIPGWELPKIQAAGIHLSNSLGFAADYFCEILHEMRKTDFQQLVKRKISIDGSRVTIRDERSVLKILAGLSKIVFPDQNIDDALFAKMARLAEVYRGLVISQMAEKDPGEFAGKTLQVSTRK
jgi:ATP-dependent Lon protease